MAHRNDRNGRSIDYRAKRPTTGGRRTDDRFLCALSCTVLKMFATATTAKVIFTKKLMGMRGPILLRDGKGDSVIRSIVLRFDVHLKYGMYGVEVEGFLSTGVHS